jgi:hypothetical protein
MNDSKGIKPMAMLARRLQHDPRFMAYVLVAYQQQEGIKAEDLALELGTLPEMLERLALCQRPPSDSPRFAELLREIADYTLTDEALLANILRRVDSLEKFLQRPVALSTPEVIAPTISPLTGLLAAARDRDESEEDQEKCSDKQSQPED